MVEPENLLERVKSGRYRAPAVRRTYIPKDDGTRQPLGIPTFEDKVAQRAVVMLLKPIYEQDFRACSYGFRPGRSAHQALERLRDDIMERNGQWILDLDISNYFGTIDHGQLRAALDKRVKDGVIRRSTDKCLSAGVLEDGIVTVPGEGTPQGGVISPLLANIFLHHVLDEWFQDVVIPRLRGRSSIVRFADDALGVFETRDDCLRVHAVLPKHFAKYGLTLHPTKTRIIEFRFAREQHKQPGEHTGGAFDFLGFTHYWRRSRRGSWTVQNAFLQQVVERQDQRRTGRQPVEAAAHVRRLRAQEDPYARRQAQHAPASLLPCASAIAGNRRNAAVNRIHDRQQPSRRRWVKLRPDPHRAAIGRRTS